MNTYRILFVGRLKGSIGWGTNYQETVIADTNDDAVMKLYDTYEHIKIVSIDLVEQIPENNNV